MSWWAEAKQACKQYEEENRVSGDFVTWKDLEDGNVAFVHLDRYKVTESVSPKNKKHVFTNLEVQCIKIYDKDGNLVRCQDVANPDHEIKDGHIRFPSNDNLLERITDAVALGDTVMMIWGHEVVTMKNGNKFHKVDTIFYKPDSEVGVQLDTFEPMLTK